MRLPSSTDTASRVDLGGIWERLIGSEILDSVPVPSSYAPVGVATLRRRFELAPLGEARRAVLRCEGVSYEGRVRINGTPVGSVHWGRSEIDVTEALVDGANEIAVEIADWQVPLGPNAAWESYGGIVREIFIDLRPDPYIENARLTYAVDLDRRAVDCTLDVFARSTTTAHGELVAELSREGVVVAGARESLAGPGASVATMTWQLDEVELWSPDAPTLYDLTVRLDEHEFSTETGFRDLRVDGNRFLLNGRPLVLKGIDRHDIWKDQGFTLTGEQIEQDFRMIKAMGANTVRLGCYPTDPRNLVWANRLGLLVSEEPGLCWLRFEDTPRETIDAGLRNLADLIRRDWNSPAFFAVMYANESWPSAADLREAVDLAKELRPGLFVSVTHLNHPLEESKRISDEGGLDFYGHHVYDYESRGFRRAAAVFTDKPLVFTEWGGRGIGQSPIVMDVACRQIATLVERGRAAGHWYWSWQDLPELSRQDAAEVVDGILLSGVVTEERRVRPDVWGALAELYTHEPGVRVDVPGAPELVLGDAGWNAGPGEFTPLSLQGALDAPGQSDAWADLERSFAEYWSANNFTELHWDETFERFWTWDAPQLTIGRVPFATPLHDGRTRPLVVRDSVAIDAELEADVLHFLGNVTVPDGFPTTGRLGERIGTYEISYGDGERQEVPLRWGHEVARSNMVSVASRINPATAVAKRVLTHTKDIRREVHQTLMLSVPVQRKPIANVEATLEQRTSAQPISSRPHETGSGHRAGEHFLLLYAVTGELRS